MDAQAYNEMKSSFEEMMPVLNADGSEFFLFGHCNATEELADLVLDSGHRIKAILDNSPQKWGSEYKGIIICKPERVMEDNSPDTVVFIVTRFYEAMNRQLKGMGFVGRIIKLVDYNTYAEYSLSEATIRRKRKRMEHGGEILKELDERYPGAFRVFCPFDALGDVYLCMSYFPIFMEKHGVKKAVVCVASEVCAKVVSLFGDYKAEVFAQSDLDAAIQAVYYFDEGDSFVAHQDRPYFVNLHKALYIKCIPLEMIYKCGVFGLEKNTLPHPPMNWRRYKDLSEIEREKAVVISPYAKSVTALSDDFWEGIVGEYRQRGYQVFTNVAGDEEALPGTIAISPAINELKSVVEHAGTFIGIRSGLCDVIRTAKCRKIALYPDYNYCDTKWKAIDMYSIDGFENLVVSDSIPKSKIMEKIF